MKIQLFLLFLVAPLLLYPQSSEDTDYKWQIEQVKKRYLELELSFQQAEQIYKFEQEKFVGSNKNLLSSWEDMDYQRTLFKEFLNEEQFKLFLENLKQTKGIRRLVGKI